MSKSSRIVDISSNFFRDLGSHHVIHGLYYSTGTSVSNQLNCRKFENGFYWLMMYWQFPNLGEMEGFQTKSRKNFDHFFWFCWRERNESLIFRLFIFGAKTQFFFSFLAPNFKFIFFYFCAKFQVFFSYLMPKIKFFLFYFEIILILSRKFNWFFFLIILANLFSSLFSHHVKRREQSSGCRKQVFVNLLLFCVVWDIW